MSISHLQFHHFGREVRRPDEVRIFMPSLGYQVGNGVFNPSQKVRLQVCHHPVVAVIGPVEGSE